jgi:hypothetical protein
MSEKTSTGKDKTNNPFHKATRQQKKLRMFLRGPAGSGKTYSALVLAKQLGKKIALIDTEKSSSTHYTDIAKFDMVDFLELYENHRYDHYLDLISQAEQRGYDVLIIDSLSHAWIGKMGILELNDVIADRDFKGNTFRAWNKTNSNAYVPLVDKLIINNNIHIIATGRTKTEYEIQQNDSGKITGVRRVGTKTQQREGLEYEFDTILDLQHGKDGFAYPEKDRTRVFPKEGSVIDDKIAKAYVEYLKS